MDIKLRPEHEKLIEEKVRTGQYRDASEVVSAALERLGEASDPTIESLRRELMIGIEQLDHGRTAAWDAEQVKAEGRRLWAERRKSR